MRRLRGITRQQNCRPSSFIGLTRLSNSVGSMPSKVTGSDSNMQVALHSQASLTGPGRPAVVSLDVVSCEVVIARAGARELHNCRIPQMCVPNGAR